MRLIDADEVKKRYPIMENDFGMVINDRLHKNLDKIPTVEAISKADMVTILDKIRAEVKKKIVKRPWLDFKDRERDRNDAFLEVLDIIDKYRGESDCRECKVEYDCYECKKYEESEG